MFNVPDDQAGMLVQCDRCGLVADVPRSDDLPNLNEDGTFSFEEMPPMNDGISVSDLHATFTDRRVDDQGREKDLRPTVDNFERIGVVADQTPTKVTPRYDPFTGELIRPLQFKEEAPMPVLAIAEPVPDQELPPLAAPAIQYAVGDARQAPPFITVAVSLFQPANMTVMFFIFIFYVVAYLARIPLNTFIIYFHLPMMVALVPNVFLWLLVAHYGCVVEDTGPEAMDELPRPMRFMDFVDDLFNPMFRSMLAIVICFGPAVWASMVLDGSSKAAEAIVITLMAAGALLFPAVLLTSLTGTTVLNLSPLRVIRVISICGLQYPGSVLLGFVSLILSVIFLLGPATFPQLADVPGVQYSNRIIALVPGVALAIYLGHLFTWHLGLMYREFHDQFPWLLQRHVRTLRS